MKDKLLSGYFTEYISSIIWDSDNLIPDNNFEYIETLEELCLSEFVVFKQIFDQLELIDKNEVIKYWNIHSESKFDEYLRFCPENYNNFDREEFFGDDYSSYIGGTKVFHLRHYIEKFNFLIRSFLLCEEEYLKKRILDPNVQKEEFNPLEILNIDMPKESYIKTKKNDLLIDVTQKFKGNLFWLFDKCEIYKNTNTSNETFCQELCVIYNTEYTDYIRQCYRKIRKSDREVFKGKVLSLLPEDHKSIIECYLNSM